MENRPRLCILGAGGHAKVIIETARAAGYEVEGVFDDELGKRGQMVMGARVLGSLSDAESCDCRNAIIGIGDNKTRAEIAARLPGMAWATLIHPSAIIASDVTIGVGTVVFAGTVVQPGTRLGRHVIVNTGATIDHDCYLEDFVHVAPGCHLAGDVRLEEGVLMGISSAAIPGTRVGAWSVVGAGAVVVDDVKPGSVVVGVPARPIEQRIGSGYG